MGQRRVVRALVAPDGFGKQTVASEYAEMVFSFQQVSWIKGDSPCFLRDLDQQVISATLLASEPYPKLVVVARVPYLDGERARLFAYEMELLIEKGCEVIVTTTPGCRGFLSAFEHYALIGPDQLLLDDDDEHHDLFTNPLMPTRLHTQEDINRKIACILWNEKGCLPLLSGIQNEYLPAEAELLIWMMLALERGTFSDVSLLMSEKKTRQYLLSFVDSLPYLGINEEEETFRTVSVPTTLFCRVCMSRLPYLVREAKLTGVNEVVEAMCEKMTHNAHALRGTHIVKALASRAASVRWLNEKGPNVLWERGSVELIKLYESVNRLRLPYRTRINAQMAWAYVQLGNDSRALEYANRVISATTPTPEERVWALMCVRSRGNTKARMSAENELAVWLTQALKDQEKVARHAPTSAYYYETEGGEGGEGGEETDAEEHFPLTKRERAVLMRAVAITLSQRLNKDPFEVWASTQPHTWNWAHQSLVVVEQELLCAALALEVAEEQGAWKQSGTTEDTFSLEAFTRLVLFGMEGLVETLQESGHFGYGAYRLSSVLERLEDILITWNLPTLPLSLRKALLKVHIEEARRKQGEVGDVSQRMVSLPHTAATGLGTHPAAQQNASTITYQTTTTIDDPLQEPPRLRIKLFGMLDVCLGDHNISGHFSTYRKAGTLLALLALNRGRDVTREALSSALWPHADTRAANKNFYRVWSTLRNLLSVQGVCPYLMRDNFGCRLNSKYVETDLDEFDRLSRYLFFGTETHDIAWEQLMRQVQASFASPLLPSEKRTEELSIYRTKYLVDLVDGLIATADRLRLEGEMQGSLWFAREALDRDRSREDAYAALMRAQMAADQRKAALETFFSCRRYLNEELGLDPSPTLVKQYQLLINGLSLDTE
jgi:DNA-binding SARP family transcriptional activator